VSSLPDTAIAPPRRRMRRRKRFSLLRSLLFIVMIAGAFIMFYPFLFMIDASLRSTQQFQSNVGHSFASWVNLFTILPVSQEMMSSFIVVALSLMIIIAVSTMAGFAFAKLPYRGSNAVLLAIVAAMLIPMHSIIIPAYVNLSQFNLLTSYTGAVLMYAALGTPFATFLMTAFYRGIADEIMEAAVIDGLSFGKIFARIALPLSLPAIATVTVLQFIQIWGDLLIGLLFLQNTDERTITVGLGVLASGRVTDIPVLMAGSLLSAIPAVIVYLIFQRHLVAGLTAGIGK
jgi:ABC-type glycerol-3-phosphate transport system permease component